MRTHYQNLKIAENAPDEVVRAAYRALSQSWHPDRNPDNPDAVRVMQILNASYDVLSDPERRRRYDQFLFEARQAAPAAAVPQPHKPQAPSAPRAQPVQHAAPQRNYNFWEDGIFPWMTAKNTRIFGVLVFVGTLVIWVHFNDSEKRHSPVPQYADTAPIAISKDQAKWALANERALNVSPKISAALTGRGGYMRPETAPNGQPWPSRAAYISGYPCIATGGLSTVTIDNTQNSSDVFLKLMRLDAGPAYAVRVCFIPKGSSFTFKELVQGNYDGKRCVQRLCPRESISVIDGRL